MHCTPTLHAYGGAGANALCSGHGAGALPFTGVNLAVGLAVSLLLIGVGFIAWKGGA